MDWARSSGVIRMCFLVDDGILVVVGGVGGEVVVPGRFFEGDEGVDVCCKDGSSSPDVDGVMV